MDITMLSAALNNPNAPMPLVAHVAFCIIATVVFGTQFLRKHTNNYIYLILAVWLSLITQFFNQDYVIAAAFFAEIILLVMAFVSSSRAKKRKEKADEDEENHAFMKKGEEDAAALKVNIRKVSDEDYEDEDEDDDE